MKKYNKLPIFAKVGNKKKSNNTTKKEDAGINLDVDKYKTSNTLSIKVASGRRVIGGELSIPEHELTINSVLGKGVVLYGTTSTGKTTIIFDLMYLCKDVFPKVIVFCTTNANKAMYTSIVPDVLIYDDFTVDTIINIDKEQQMAAGVYNIANNIDILYSLFKLVANNTYILKVRDLMSKKNSKLKSITNNKKLNPSEKKNEKQRIINAYDDILTKIYKKVIDHNKRNFTGLTDEQKIAVKYLHFNPNILLIFDDCTSELKIVIQESKKRKNLVINDFFYKGRHKYITHIYTIHDECNLDASIKKGAMCSIFTDPAVATGFFTKQSSGFNDQTQAYARAAIREVFDENPEHKYRKLVYVRDDAIPFRHYTASLHDDFIMCSDTVRDYCEKIKKSSSYIDKSNPYAKIFYS